MKKIAIILAALLFSILPQPARANVVFYSRMPPYYTGYTCTLQGFVLAGGQGVYRLIGPVYVTMPGYTYAMSPVMSNPVAPAELEATLTLIPPSNIISPQRRAVIPPLWVDFSFSSDFPVHRLTVYIANPVNRFDTQISCLQTGATQ